MRDLILDGGKAATNAEEELASAVADIFGPLCKAAWLSGSFVYRGAKPGRSDIDVVVVLGPQVPTPADGETLQRIFAFIDVYLSVHARMGLDPDLEFPSEYVVPASIEEAIGWRGLALEGAVASHFPPVESADHWTGRPDRWFHAWLSETAFSRFLAGDPTYHAQSKLDAWKAILRFLLLRSVSRAMTLDDFWPGLAQFGVKPSYRPFWPQELGWVRRAAEQLEQEGFAAAEDEHIVPNLPRLREWERELASRIAQGDDPGPLLLPPDIHRKIGTYAARQWEARRHD